MALAGNSGRHSNLSFLYCRNISVSFLLSSLDGSAYNLSKTKIPQTPQATVSYA